MNTIMDFVKVTQAEYRRTLVKTAFFAPIAIELGRPVMRFVTILGLLIIPIAVMLDMPFLYFQ